MGESMWQCDLCHGPAYPLARTATQVWVGCPTCHRTRKLPIENGELRDDEARMVPDGVGRPQLSILRDSLITGLSVGLALTIRILLGPVLGTTSPFLVFTPAVAISALYAGAVPGIVATGASAVLGGRFFLAGIHEPSIEKWDRLALFVLVGIVITASSAMLRRSRQQLSESLWREQQSRAMAEAADRTKDDFLALISHELQTPVSVVVGWTTAIRQRRLNPEAIDHALDVVDRNARMLSRLVDDVLDRSRIATGTLRLDLQLISLADVVRAAVDQVRARIDAAGVRLDVSLPPDEATVLGDSIRLQQVFANVLSNATKFTPKGGLISVSMKVADQATVSISDTGAGIAADFLPHVFNTFRQGREARQRGPQGLGLGMSIARYLVERHEGTIGVASEGPGRGSTFTISLPLASHLTNRTGTARPDAGSHQTAIGSIH